MLSKQIAAQKAYKKDQPLVGAAVRELHLLCKEEDQTAEKILLVDSSALHADAVMDPGERCLALYQSILATTRAHLLLLPPAPPSGERATLTTAQLLQVPAFFHAFLIAALRASAGGRVSVLLPSVQATDEIITARRMLSAAMDELYTKGEPFDALLALGICLGTPETLTASRKLLEEADLLTIDTEALSHTVTGLMPMLNLVEIAVGNAHVLRRFAIVDGVLSTDARALPHLFAMGADAVTRPFSASVEISDKIHTKSSCK